MNEHPDSLPPAQTPSRQPGAVPEARVQRRRPFNVIWLIPLVAALIAAYLAWRAISQEGPTITISFATADGLTVGQTKIRHKAVDLGTVKRITLSKDMSHVVVQADMSAEAEQFLTSNARFWVVRPRFTPGGVSGLETLVSGAYIEMDPGARGGEPRREFQGLEEPPAVRSDEPGRSYTLKANRLGSLGIGSPVFYRDIIVGEVLGYDLPATHPAPNQGVAVKVFIRKPYDDLIHANTHFWNASGVAVNLGAAGIKFELESLRAVLSGGIAFDTDAPPRDGPLSPSGATFTLYPDQATADAAGYQHNVPMLVYFKGSVRGLAVGAPVEMFGIPVGTVTDINLEFDPTGGNSRVAVRFAVQPERIFGPDNMPDTPPFETARSLVAHGMRAQLRSASLITGQQVVALDFFPAAPPAQVSQHEGTIVIPGTSGGFENITSGLGDILAKLNALPLEDIARNLNDALSGLREFSTAPELQQSVHTLNATLFSIQQLARSANAGVGPAMEKLPAIAQGLQSAVDRANKLLTSTDAGYGGNSQFRRDLERLMDQFSDMARSVRLLADFLDQHPEALLRGRSGAGGAP
jgi:paraquat-inducible protein B